MQTSIDPFGNNPDNDTDQNPQATTNAGPETEIYHQGRDGQGQPAQTPPLTGPQMDEVGW
jgi:hypothetical protein